MTRSGVGEGRTIGIVKKREAGMATADVGRGHGVRSATFDTGKARQGGRELADARRLKAPGDANATLKTLLAEAMLDTAILKQVADTPLSGDGVARVLDAVIARRRRPAPVLSDNGTQLTSMAILSWCQRTGVEWHSIAPR